METVRTYVKNEAPHKKAGAGPDWGLDVLNVRHTVVPGQSCPGHYGSIPGIHTSAVAERITNYQLVYIAGGKGLYESDNVRRVTVEAGTILLLYPGTRHHCTPLDTPGYEEYALQFNGPYARYLLKQDCFTLHAPIHRPGLNAALISILNRLVDDWNLEGPGHSMLSSCGVIQLLGLVYTAGLPNEKCCNRKEKLINQIKFKIHENVATAINLEHLAAENNVSYIWFRKAFKEVVGIAPGQYQLNLKVERASRMLRETNLSVTEVAYQNGFDSEHHFSRIFKKKTSLSPSRFKDQPNDQGRMLLNS